MVNDTTQKRTPRSLETREQDARPKTWMPASTLPVPQEQEGYKFRWIRRSMMGQEVRLRVLEVLGRAVQR